MSVELDEHVTALLNLVVYRTRVDEIHHSGKGFYCLNTHGRVQFCYWEDEGIAWMRGHATEAEADALCTAWALHTSAVPASA